MTGARLSSTLALLLVSLSMTTVLVPSAAAVGSCADGAERIGEQMVALEVNSPGDDFIYYGAHYMPRVQPGQSEQVFHEGFTSTFTLAAMEGAVTLQVVDAQTCQQVTCDAGVDPVSTEGQAASCTVPVGDYVLSVSGYGPSSGERVDYALTINTV